MNARLGLFGGSFDPIHFGHLISARSIAEQLGLSRVVLIPAARPPHKLGARLTDGAHRLAMIRLAVHNDALFEVNDLELRRAGPSYTIDTVQTLQGSLGSGIELHWIIGLDSLPELATWHRISELVDMVRIVTAKRPGSVDPDLTRLRAVLGAPAVERLQTMRVETPAIEISASDIRRRVGAGLSIRYLCPEPVVEYIGIHGLYRTSE